MALAPCLRAHRTCQDPTLTWITFSGLISMLVTRCLAGADSGDADGGATAKPVPLWRQNADRKGEVRTANFALSATLCCHIVSVGQL